MCVLLELLTIMEKLAIREVADKAFLMLITFSIFIGHVISIINDRRKP